MLIESKLRVEDDTDKNSLNAVRHARKFTASEITVEG